MPDLEVLGPVLAIGLLLLVMLWFTFGTQRNIRIGNNLLAWLQDGLPILGRRTTLRWLGSSAVELGIVEPAQPFREATVIVVLEPRDVGLLWGWARARGRRDFMIVRANLKRPPRDAIEVADRRAWTGDLVESPPEGWRPIDWPGADVTARSTPGAATAAVRRAWARLDAASGGVWRLVVQPVVPHLEVHVRPPAKDIPARRLLSAIADLAVAVAPPG